MYGLAAVMFQAAQVEDNTICDMSEKVAQLEYENRRLREVLQFSYSAVSNEDSATGTSDSDVQSRTYSS